MGTELVYFTSFNLIFMLTSLSFFRTRSVCMKSELPCLSACSLWGNSSATNTSEKLSKLRMTESGRGSHWSGAWWATEDCDYWQVQPPALDHLRSDDCRLGRQSCQVFKSSETKQNFGHFFMHWMAEWWHPSVKKKTGLESKQAKGKAKESDCSPRCQSHMQSALDSQFTTTAGKMPLRKAFGTCCVKCLAKEITLTLSWRTLDESLCNADEGWLSLLTDCIVCCVQQSADGSQSNGDAAAGRGRCQAEAENDIAADRPSQGEPVSPSRYFFAYRLRISQQVRKKTSQWRQQNLCSNTGCWLFTTKSEATVLSKSTSGITQFFQWKIEGVFQVLFKDIFRDFKVIGNKKFMSTAV